MNILISACLIGVNCRYDGDSIKLKEFDELCKRYHLIPICPEQLGGLTTPRPPAEILNGKVITKCGDDVTQAFKRGATQALKLAKLYDCKIAILKERSPSCGSKERYDGSFRGQLVLGDGLTASLFKQHKIKVLGESEISSLL